MIYTYEMFRALASPEDDAVKGQWVPLGQEAIENLVREVTNNLREIGFYRQKGREEQEHYFRDIFSRAALTEREGQYFAKIIAKAARLGGWELISDD